MKAAATHRAVSGLPIDLGAVAAELRAGRATPAWLGSWLPATWEEPQCFAASLYAHASTRLIGAIRSRPDLGVDLYGDCITAQLGAGRSALLCMEDGQALERSFEWLHDRCSALASAWRSSGVAAGSALAIVLPVGVDYALALLTGLRLGLVVSVIPPLGPSFVRNRLARIAPDHVVTIDRFTPLLAPGAPPTLSPRARGGDATVSTSHTYAPGEIALRLLSPFGDAQAAPFELSASTLHVNLLRDGLLVLGLQPGERIAAPSFDPLQWQPLGLLCTWMAGAAWVELDRTDLVSQPRTLQQLGVNVLGVDCALRDLILSRGIESCHGVKRWFRSLSDTFDYVHWLRLEQAFSARMQLGFCVLFNAASGGAHLFSAPSPRVEPACLWPVPGREFVIAQPGADLLASVDGTGVYTPLNDGEPDLSLPRLVIARLDHGWTLGGSIDPGPQARALPVLEIAASARRHPSVREACVVLTPGRFANDGHSVLLTFVADLEPDGSARVPSTEVLERIERDLGPPHVPERVDTFALHPRFVDGALDRDWCTSQYLSGTLTRKARIPLFSTLARLAWIFEPSEPDVR